MNCPLCGATERSRGTGKIWWECGSYQYEDRRSYFQESTECLRRQLAEMTRCRDLAVQGHHTEIDMQLTAAEEKLVQMTLHTAMCNSQRIAVTDQRDRAVDAVRVTIIRLNNGGWPTVGGERDIALEQYLKAVVAEADAAKKEKPNA